jgi:hypothetical protein
MYYTNNSLSMTNKHCTLMYIHSSSSHTTCVHRRFNFRPAAMGYIAAVQQVPSRCCSSSLSPSNLLPALPAAVCMYELIDGCISAGSASEKATSPAKALQDVKQKLTDYANRQPSTAGFALCAQLCYRKPSHDCVSFVGALLSDKQYGAAKHTSAPAYEDPTSEIADIDSRLHALQNFLKMAKSNASS